MLDKTPQHLPATVSESLKYCLKLYLQDAILYSSLINHFTEPVGRAYPTTFSSRLGAALHFTTWFTRHNLSLLAGQAQVCWESVSRQYTHFEFRNINQSCQSTTDWIIWLAFNLINELIKFTYWKTSMKVPFWGFWRGQFFVRANACALEQKTVNHG